VADLLKGLTGGSWALLIAWFLPAGLVVGYLGLGVLPSVATVPWLHGIAGWDTTTRALVAGFVVVTLAIVANALSTQLYGVLEGYRLWRQSWFDAGRERHLTRKAALKKAYDDAPKEEKLTRALLYQRYSIYPDDDDDDEVGPTLLQNSLRAFERYGNNHFGLNVLVFWTELGFVTPKGLSDDIDRARASVDFFVALFWSTLLLSLCSFAAVVVRWTHDRTVPVAVLVVGAVLPGLGWLCYLGAVASVPYWRSTVQALVNLGRAPLAVAAGLELPATDAEEREMWSAFGAFVHSPYSVEKARALDAHRRPRGAPPPQV
jgi:hypothetical protein